MFGLRKERWSLDFVREHIVSERWFRMLNSVEEFMESAGCVYLEAQERAVCRAN